jgi:ABC-type branched-subunit amino acid transport system substrate-binding protein
MRRSRFVATAAAGAALAARPAAAQAATVKIGYIDSFSGGLADIGEHMRLGVALAVSEANARGRSRFEVAYADDNSAPPIGVNEARRLINQEQVDVLLLGTSSAVTLAVGPLAAQTGIFALAMGAQDTSITGERAQRVVYRFAPNVKMQIQAVAQRILTFGKRWYFIVDDFAYGKDSYARLSAVVKRAGGEEVGADVLPLGTADYSAALTKLRNTNAEVLVLCQGGFDSAKTAKQFVEFGLHKRIHLGGVSGSMEDYYWKAIPADQLVGSTFAINWAPSVSDSARRIARKLEPLVRDQISSRHVFGYLCASQLIDRMRAAGTTKADAIAQAFADHRFDAYKGSPAVWRSCDHQCVQDEYAGAIVSSKRRLQTGFMFDVVAEIPALQGAGACGDSDPAAAAAALAQQRIPDRSGYQAKPV